MSIQAINPATGEVVATHDEMTPHLVAEIIDAVHAAFIGWRRASYADRAVPMRKAAGILRKEASDFAHLMAREMGKPVRDGVAEAQKCAVACEYFAEHAAKFLQREVVETDARSSFVTFNPLGVVLAVMPWNFPLWQAMRFAAPALMAGNVGLLKHASNVPQTALFMEELFRDAGFPAGVFQTLLIGSDQVERVLRDPRVKAVTLTGSEAAGRAVGSVAGDEVKASVLELGGSDPFIVMPSAHLEKAARVATTSRTQNNGQSCISAKRFIVDHEIADEFERLFVEQMSGLRVGDPMDEATDVGPLATAQGRTDIEEQVADAVDKGATVLCGGRRLDGPGWYYPPTVISNITSDMRLFHEEVFGPVAQLFRVAGIDEAIALANATTFGLGANIWTEDAVEEERAIRDVEAGGVFINGMTTSYPELPFGGVKASGYGRELSAHGIREFCNIKTVWVASGQ